MFQNDFNKLDDYIKAHSEPESELLKALSRQTHLKIMRPRMLSGHIQGRVLAMMSHMIKPEKILEIGTYTGYSALCLAEGLTENGKLYTYDINDEIECFTRSFLEKSEFARKIEYRLRNVLEDIDNIPNDIDLVFMDGDKRQYPQYFEAILPKVKKGGYIIADNVLWSEKVIDKNDKNDPYTKALLVFNSMVQESNMVQNVIFPFRDGLMVMCKNR